MIRFDFKLLVESDLDLLFEWLNRPHVAEWWDGPLSPANSRAIRCYEKAGFKKAGVVHTPDGPALLMTIERPALTTSP
jgi:RimJ/RimL family protein N-acetyltransferase